MNDNERGQIQIAINATCAALEHVQADLADGDLSRLYESTKLTHDAALSIWAATVTILRARKGLDQPDREADAINLEELFGQAPESGVAQAPGGLET